MLKNSSANTKLYHGFALTILGIVLYCLSDFSGGSVAEEFASGILMGISVGAMVIGVVVAINAVISDCYPEGDELKNGKK